MSASAPGYIPSNVFVELGLANLSEERKLAMLSEMNELVHKRAMLRILEQLPEEAKQDLDTISDLSQDDQVEKLLQHVPNLAEILIEEVEQVKLRLKAVRISVEEGA